MSRKINHEWRNKLDSVFIKGGISVYATGWGPKIKEDPHDSTLKEDREIDIFPSDSRPNKFPGKIVIWSSLGIKDIRFFYHFIEIPEKEIEAIEAESTKIQKLPPLDRLPTWEKFLCSKYRISNIRFIESGRCIRRDVDVRVKRKQRLTSR